MNESESSKKVAAMNGVIFNYDLLGYGFMALSTFFTGLTIEDKMKSDKVLKWLMMIHGIFFSVCLIMPMTGILMQKAGSDYERLWRA